jgi:tetratricopeptide (TPR) repeat protein
MATGTPVSECRDALSHRTGTQPDCWLAHNNLVPIYLAKGKTDEALSHAKEAVRLRPEDAEPYIAIGDVLLRKRQPTEAIVQYKKAVAIQLDFAEGYSHLGSGYLYSQRFSEAITQYRKALSLAPRLASVRNNLAWLLATCSDGSLRDGDEAVTLAEQADQLSGGNNPLILHTLSAAYAETGQVVRAMETARHAKELADTQGNQGLARTLDKELRDYESRL